MPKFIRQAEVIIRIRRDDFNGYERTITISGLRVSFNIRKNLSLTTNSGVIKIWNLSQENRNLIKDFGDEVTIRAGYERGDGMQLLYIGDTTAVSHHFDFPEIVTQLECGDGEKYVNQVHDSLSFKAQTPVRDVVQTIAQRMGINIIEFAVSPNLVYENSFSFSGLLKEALDKVCAKLDLQWSVQNNGLQIIPLTGSIVQPAFPVNVNTGMIGVPQRYTYKGQDFYVLGRAIGWKVNTLLYPLILPGSKIDIDSRYLGFQGIFLVQTIRHNGDTYGPLWTSEMECTQLAL